MNQNVNMRPKMSPPLGIRTWKPTNPQLTHAAFVTPGDIHRATESFFTLDDPKDFKILEAEGRVKVK
jgi:hypothetical protein